MRDIPLQVSMTRVFSRFSTVAVAGLALAAVHVNAQQQMPTPRYQTPGIAQPQAQAPVPQVNFPITPAITPNGTVAEEVIVRVNDQIITRSDLMRGEDILQQELAQGGPQAGDPAERQRNMLRDLIDQQLLISKAKDLGVNADAEVVRRLDEIRKQNNLPSLEALEEAARRQGVSFEDFKANIRNSVMTQSVVRDEVGRNIRMTKADEQKFYDAHKEELSQPEQAKLSEILIPTAADANDDAIARAQTKAGEVYQQLKGGADFAATAKSVSGGPTAAQGGDLGVFKRGQLAKVLEDKTFAQQPGDFTEPIRTRQGFVILKTVEHQQAGVPPLDKVEPEVQNAMYQEAIQPALRVYLTKLREDSYVDVKPGFVDTGASAKQTKPVYAAYVAPAPKKKVVEKKRMDAQKDAARLRTVGLTPKGNTIQPLSNVQLDKHGKPKKVKREKVRFGQAPRSALPDAGGDDDATATAATRPANSSGQDVLGTATTNPAVSAANPGYGSGSGHDVAPAGLPEPTNTNTIAANAPEVTGPPAPPRQKTRYSSREPEVKAQKNQKQVVKAINHVTEKPSDASTQEQQAVALQSSALGLNGDTTKKKKKRKKGEAKERIQEKAPEAKPDLVDNGLPDRLHQQNGPAQTTGTPSASAQSGNLPAENSQQQEKQRRGKEPVTNPSADATTLPPADAPAPGTTTPALTPSTNGTTTPNSSTPLPQTPNQPN